MWLNLSIKKNDSYLPTLRLPIVLIYSDSFMITFTFYFDIIIVLQEVIKIVQRNPVHLHPVSSNGYILHSYSTVLK